MDTNVPLCQIIVIPCCNADRLMFGKGAPTGPIIDAERYNEHSHADRLYKMHELPPRADGCVLILPIAIVQFSDSWVSHYYLKSVFAQFRTHKSPQSVMPHNNTALPHLHKCHTRICWVVILSCSTIDRSEKQKHRQNGLCWHWLCRRW